MASDKRFVAKDINFIETPAAQPSSFEKHDVGVPVTNVCLSGLHCGVATSNFSLDPC